MPPQGRDCVPGAGTPLPTCDLSRPVGDRSEHAIENCPARM